MSHIKSSRLARLLKWIGSLLLLLMLGIGLWLGHTYQPEPFVQSYTTSATTHSLDDGSLQLTPDSPNQVGLVFYPGAQVAPAAYLPLLEPLRVQGYTIIIAKMPLNLAVLDGNAAERLMAKAPTITKWFIGGHSMGGAMASQFAAEHPDTVSGLMLVGAYPYKDYPASKTLIVYGDLNTSVAKKVNQTENVYVLAGGNHAKFGAYGHQFGDAAATLSAEQQRQQTANYMLQFMQQH